MNDSGPRPDGNGRPVRPSAVIFDMDGLLFDSEALYRDAIMAAAQELGVCFAVEDFLALVGRSWALNRAALQAHLGPSGDVETFRTAWMRHYEAMIPSLALKPGVVALLARLDELGLKRAICTSSGRADVERNLALHALTGRFDAIVAAGDYARGKPAPDPFLRAAEVLGVSPAACLALEDSHNGVRSAAAAGMRTIMVPDLLPPTEALRSLCSAILVDLDEVHALLV